ncbi:1,2-epoxyphenylacetyl-CoA isomerase [Rhodobacteraceae bacterium THAF1]|uniref:oxepin-CoA hydrolase, alternative type n=1 Tax=Palleronia sp. THAF1 TaxID=2587842 RepID=UPI000F3B14C5|nr:enoyl-CoA hydratase family protein [Palleronia sp. THAF1]QFU08007.1 1,2-epoxyphenylacetyl-CoA isomerase [Palleronia sp. THAF1]VDC27860.1 1,2-epoxyphenylacetyl-CoA isomerase [Rhodobacteraceae bacterium THAF1]
MSARIDTGDHAVIVWNCNAAKRNALTPEYYAAVIEACAAANADGTVGAVILAGEGDFFCAGGDLNTLATRAELPKRERAAKIDALHDVIRAIRDCPCPVIAAVEGGAAGAGWSLAAACDVLIAAEGTTFSAAYVKAGLVPDGGLTHALARALPVATLMPLLLTGAPITAERLFALGAVSQLCAPGDAVSESRKMAHALGHGPREAQVRIKRLAQSARDATLDDQLDAERDAMARAQGGPEAVEGISAFMEKRTPKFGGLRA